MQEIGEYLVAWVYHRGSRLAELAPFQTRQLRRSTTIFPSMAKESSRPRRRSTRRSRRRRRRSSARQNSWKACSRNYESLAVTYAFVRLCSFAQHVCCSVSCLLSLIGSLFDDSVPSVALPFSCCCRCIIIPVGFAVFLVVVVSFFCLASSKRLPVLCSPNPACCANVLSTAFETVRSSVYQSAKLTFAYIPALLPYSSRQPLTPTSWAYASCPCIISLMSLIRFPNFSELVPNLSVVR